VIVRSLSFLIETWHHAGAVFFRRLRADEFQVNDRPRPRPVAESSSLSTNHGGVAVVSVPEVHLSSLDAVSNPVSSELLYVFTRISFGQSSCIVVVIYRPGSAPVTSSFFDDLSEISLTALSDIA